jgi:hypothetical protein
MEDLLKALANVPELAEALHWVRRLPNPRYADDAWAIVDALLEILPRAAAYLLLTFRDAGVIDFTQGTLGALARAGRRRADGPAAQARFPAAASA